jgi:hypothetical protein
MNIEALDHITRNLSAFESFQDILDAQGGYRPSIYLVSPASWTLAEAYDKAQEERGDPRRAFRGGRWPLNRPPKTWYWLLALEQTGGTVKEVADFLGYSRGTVRKMLCSLKKRGLVQREGVLRTGRRGRPPQLWGLSFRGTLRIKDWVS